MVNYVRVVLACVLMVCASTNAFAYKSTYNVSVGQTFTVYTTYKSYTQSILWTYDAAVVQPVGTIGTTSASVTFKAVAASPSAGSIIQAVTYYYRSGTSSSGINKSMDDWKVVVTDNATVSLDKSNITLHVGESELLTATPSGSYSGTYTWSTTASGVAYTAVGGTSRQQRVYARGVGTTVITVTLKNGSTAQCTVTVKPDEVTSAQLTSRSKVLSIDEYCYLSVYTLPASAPVTSESWVSMNPAVASVNSLGRVTGVSVGTTQIYCVVNGTVMSDVCVVAVMKPTFTVNSTSPSYNAGNQPVSVQPSVTFCRAIYQDVAFTSISMKDEWGNLVAGQPSIRGAVLTFTPDSLLTTGTQYTLTVPANAVKDKYDNSNSYKTILFTTEGVAPPIAIAVVDISEAGYTTYFNSTEAYTLPPAVTGYMFNSSQRLVPVFAPESVVPANTPLVLGGEVGSYVLFSSVESCELPDIQNQLRGSDEAELTTGGDYFYALSLDSNWENVGFYFVNEGGAAFTNAAHKAYLALSDIPDGAPMRILFEENTTTSLDASHSCEQAVKFFKNGNVYISRNGIVYDVMGTKVR